MIESKLVSTNGLPEILLKAFEYMEAQYDGHQHINAGLSATSLLKPAFMVHLEEILTGTVEIDIEDRLWALLGSSVHKLIEDTITNFAPEDKTHIVSEQRFFDEELKIHGKVDLYDTLEKHLLDFKVTSKFSSMKGKHKPEWEQQLNILAHLIRKAGLPAPKRLTIIAIYRDLMHFDTLKHDMPKKAIEAINIPLWSEEATLAFIKDRIKQHRALVKTPCTREEKWETQAGFAVIKIGSKRASKICSTLEEAQDYARRQRDASYKIEQRFGEPTRCLRYCLVADRCPIHLAYKNIQI